MSGQFVQLGTKLGTTYPETGDEMFNLIDDFYNGIYSFMRSAGAATYGDNGYFNAIMGKEITAAMFSSDNVFTAIGARPYNHEGVRIATALATYGVDSTGNFTGIGADTVHDGRVPDSVQMPIGEFRQPYKELPFSFNYGLGLQALESKDDTIAYKQYIDMMSANYSDYMDRTLLRPVHLHQPVRQGEETSLNSLYRVLSGHTEIGKRENGVDITAEMVSPYGGEASSRGDFYEWRSSGESVLDANILDANGGTLTLDLMDELYTTTSIYWNDSGAPNNKAWFLSNVSMRKLAALARAQQAYLNSVYVQRDFNGVKTYPGRDVGFMLRSYQDIPIIIDGNMNFNYTNNKVSSTYMGVPVLADMNHLWMSVLTPVEVWSTANPALTRILQEVNVMNSRMELRSDRYLCHGKIIGLQDSY